MSPEIITKLLSTMYPRTGTRLPVLGPGYQYYNTRNRPGGR